MFLNYEKKLILTFRIRTPSTRYTFCAEQIADTAKKMPKTAKYFMLHRLKLYKFQPKPRHLLSSVNEASGR